MPLTTPRTDTLGAVHDMSIDELRREYISLKSTGYSLSVEESHLIDKIEVLREEAVRAELNAEMKEEQMSNQLFRRLEGAEKEVQRYKAMLKDEENEVVALAARIKKLRHEMNEVENVLEERQEYLLMNLQRKLLETARKKTSVEQELMLERQRYLEVLVTKLAALRGRSASGSADFFMTTYPTNATGDSTAVEKSTSAPTTVAVPVGVASGVSAGTAATESSSTATENPLGASTSEKALVDETMATPAQPLRSPYSSFTKGSAKDAPLSGTPHLRALTPNARASLSSTPHSGDLTPMSSHSSETHQAVVALERKLNQLLIEQAAAMQRTSATEKQCAELDAKLRSVQEATFLDRARAAKLKEELKEARARLAEANSGMSGTASNASMLGNSFDDSMASGVNQHSFDPTVSLTMSNLSLRERTRELLSSIPPPPMN